MALERVMLKRWNKQTNSMVGVNYNLQNWARTHAVLVIGLYELLNPTT
jgi:hypothetical protein